MKTAHFAEAIGMDVEVHASARRSVIAWAPSGTPTTTSWDCFIPSTATRRCRPLTVPGMPKTPLLLAPTGAWGSLRPRPWRGL